MEKNLRNLVFFMVLLLMIIPSHAVLAQDSDYNRYPPESASTDISQRSYSYEGRHVYYQELDIVEFLMEMDDLSILAGAMKAAGLEAEWSERGPFTIFAPRNMAFRRLLPEAADYLLTCSPETLEKFLNNHMVPGIVTDEDLLQGEMVTAITGKTLPVSRRWFNPVVGGAMITGKAVALDNGLLYAIDSVIPDDKVAEIEKAYRRSLTKRSLQDTPVFPGRQGMPGLGGMYYPRAEEVNVMDFLAHRGELSIFFGAIKASGLDTEIRQSTGITVFAPINAAFEELEPEQSEYLMTCDKGELLQIVRSHLLNGIYSETDLRDMPSVSNLNGQPLALSTDWFSTTVNGAAIRSYEVVTANGIIHMVDRVLLP